MENHSEVYSRTAKMTIPAPDIGFAEALFTHRPINSAVEISCRIEFRLFSPATIAGSCCRTKITK